MTEFEKALNKWNKASIAVNTAANSKSAKVRRTVPKLLLKSSKLFAKMTQEYKTTTLND